MFSFIIIYVNLFYFISISLVHVRHNSSFMCWACMVRDSNRVHSSLFLLCILRLSPFRLGSLGILPSASCLQSVPLAGSSHVLPLSSIAPISMPSIMSWSSGVAPQSAPGSVRSQHPWHGLHASYHTWR